MWLEESAMSDIAIRVDRLSKRYRIGLREEKHETLGGAVLDLVRRPMENLRRLRQLSKFSEKGSDTEDIIWALKDVSLDVKKGEVIGIIGRNGAGKTTLLKLMSRITEPTSGEVTVRGRVGSLLEVGTGFHPDLTGRENIYLNGTVLGMKKTEIERKFEEIVDFSGVEKFIDTPVKRYSSGMRVRLAFAVAAHLEPEILLVDEVLSVGDMDFQKKCLGKMGDVVREGRTVLFVSHNMQAVRALCPRSILLSEGALVEDGLTADTLETYYESLRQNGVDTRTDVTNPQNRRGSGAVRFSVIRIENEFGRECVRFKMGSTIRFVLSYKTFSPVNLLLVEILLWSSSSREIVTSVRHLVSEKELYPGATGSVVIEIPKNNLRPGEYPLYFWLGSGLRRPYDIVDDMTMPLMIYADENYENLGFDASKSFGFFNIESRMRKICENP
jgi:lipopolysaccharide transport system ATP-binding protein